MNPANILLVEDEQYLRELYHEILVDQGYNVETAADGEEGFNKLKQGGWDLVILDIILPKLNGLEIMRKIRSNPPEKPNKKIVFLTNLDKDEEIKEALQLGDGYFIKSQITPGSLVNELKNFLNADTPTEETQPQEEIQTTPPLAPTAAAQPVQPVVPTTAPANPPTPLPPAGDDGNTAAS
jgi:DNA-binding response OmpR family regulator